MDHPDFPLAQNVAIDERWMQEWLDYGFAAIIAFLTYHANFDAWCVENGREEPQHG